MGGDMVPRKKVEAFGDDDAQLRLIVLEAAGDGGAVVQRRRRRDGRMLPPVQARSHGAADIIRQQAVDLFHDATDEVSHVLLAALGHLFHEVEQHARQAHVRLQIVQQFRLQQQLLQAATFNGILLKDGDEIPVEKTADVSQPADEPRTGHLSPGAASAALPPVCRGCSMLVDGVQRLIHESRLPFQCAASHALETLLAFRTENEPPAQQPCRVIHVPLPLLQIVKVEGPDILQHLFRFAA